MRLMLLAIAFAMFLLAVVACSPEPGDPGYVVDPAARETPAPLPALDFPRNADAWWMRVPAGHSGYTACRRMWIVVDTGAGDELGGGRDLIWYEIYRPGDPMVMPDRQQQQVHEMVSFGDCVPWVQPGIGGSAP